MPSGAPVQLTHQTTADVADLTQDEDGVKLFVKDRNSSESRTIRSRWVVGADSANSTIRDLVKIDFEDQGKSSAIYAIQPSLPLNKCFVLLQASRTTGLWLIFYQTPRPTDTSISN